MKYECRDLVKAIDRAVKDGANHLDVEIDDRTSKLMLKYTVADSDVVILLASVESGLWNDISIIRRF